MSFSLHRPNMPEKTLLKRNKSIPVLLLTPRMKLLYMISPFIVFSFIFTYFPLYGWSYAFIDYFPGAVVFKQPFVGMKYFNMIFTGGSGFLITLRNTVVLYGLGLLCSPVPIIFAVLLGELRSKKFTRVVQTMTSLPNFISWILVFAVFFIFLSNEGFVNTILLKAGLINKPTDLLANPDIAWYFQTLIGLWKGLGWIGIIYLAAISGIDVELYDAAVVDGAGRLGKIWHITVPGLMPTYVIMLILSISSLLSVGFEQFYVFRNTMTQSRLDVLDVYIYNKGLGGFQYSYATAVGMFKSLVGLALLFFANAVVKKIRGQSVF